MIELLVEDGYEYEDNGARVTTYRPASPSEVVEAARQHVDYEAAWIAFEDQYENRDENGIDIKAIVDAALGIEGEETDG